MLCGELNMEYIGNLCNFSHNFHCNVALKIKHNKFKREGYVIYFRILYNEKKHAEQAHM